MYRSIPILLAMLVCIPCFASEEYKGPISLIATKDGKTIYVVNRDSSDVAVLNTADNNIVHTIALSDDFFPLGAALSADEKILYVVGGDHKGAVLAVDLGTRTITKTAKAGHTPAAAALSPDGTKLFVCNQFTNDVSQFALPDLTLTRTIKAVREPRAAVVTQDGKYVLVANSIPLAPGNYIDHDDPLTDPNINIYVASEITIINIETGETNPILLPNGSGALHGMAMSPDGRFIYTTAIIARFLLPTTQVERGWMNTAGIVIVDTTQLEDENRGFVNTVLIDDVDLGAANPWGIATSADGTKIYVAVAGTSELMVINAVEMHRRLDTRTANPLSIEIQDYLGFLAGMKTRIRLPGQGARAVAVADGNVYVGMYFSDTLQKLREAQLRPTARPVEIALGPAPVWTPERRGEIWWNDARLCFQHWQSCASCHPDARMDGYNWDLLNDGMGNPKNATSLLYTHLTPPSMWSQTRDNPERNGWDTETMGIECIRTGFRWIHFTEPNEEISRDIDAYLVALKQVPSPFLVDGKLSERAERGKLIFHDPRVGCATCHPPETWYTDMKMHDVNSQAYYDRTPYFDTPTLHEVWRTAPYMHDGRYVEMRDVFKLGLHGDTIGDVAGLSDEQIDDLVEYIMSL
ncbi:MAG: beta-propeller fold lactonase family protein [Planctomycetaceae bacterium]|nr:beta-propeller fold lactonase family protein [Planctomycetaceae bacterium]